jgi:N-acetylglucosamine kinase-like BadF-type ATPase
MAYYIGFDGGGTKTECVLTDKTGRILAQGVAGPSNPLRIGFDQAFLALASAADHVLTAAKLDAGQISAVCAGLAGAGQKHVVKRVMAFLVETFPQAVVHVTTDLDVALEAAVGAGEGVILIAGTGSAAYGRNAAGKTVRTGGYGAWVGDEGSAFDIGRRAVAAMARSRDGLAPVTLLSDMVPAALALPTWEALIEKTSASPHEAFPKIFPIVLEAAGAEDTTANEILFTAALALAQLASAAIHKLGLQKARFTLAKVGGVHGHLESFDRALDALLASGAPQARIVRLEVPPALGAATLAQRIAAGQSQVAHGK